MLLYKPLPSMKALMSFTRHLSYASFLQKLPTYKAGDIHLNLDDKNGIGTITIDNPQSKNAISGSIAIKLGEIIHELKGWTKGKAIILHGSDDQFCSGGDLKNFVKYLNTPEQGIFMCKYMQEIFLEFSKLPFVTVAALQGKTLGGGAEMASACDYRLMDKDAVVAFVQLRMGVTTGWGGYSRLVKLVGAQNGMRLLLTGKKLNTTDALEIGFADDVLPTNQDVIKACKFWLESNNFLQARADLIQDVKRMTTAVMTETMRDSLDIERSVFGKYWAGELQEEALSRKIHHG